MTARALPRPRTLVRIVPATMGVDASLPGAAELAFEPLLVDPAMWVGRRDVVPEDLTAQRVTHRAASARNSLETAWRRMLA